jgi:6-phosphogluconolactonase
MNIIINSKFRQKLKFLVVKKNQNWKRIFLNLFDSIIFKNTKKNINILLTGGSTIKKLYIFWSKNFKFYKKKFNFFVSDERLFVNNKYTNSYNIQNNFLINIARFEYKFFKINSYPKSILDELNNYSKKIKKIDIAILSLGKDGHLASIFNRKKRLEKFFFCEVKNRYPFRISAGINEIKKTKVLIILVVGFKKGKQLKKSLSNKNSILHSILSNNNNFFLIDYLAYKGYTC